MALRRRSYGHHHRPDWEQRLCRVDAALGDGDISPTEARAHYRAAGREQPGDLPGEEDQATPAGTRPHAGEPAP